MTYSPVNYDDDDGGGGGTGWYIVVFLCHSAEHFHFLQLNTIGGSPFWRNDWPSALVSVIPDYYYYYYISVRGSFRLQCLLSE